MGSNSFRRYIEKLDTQGELLRITPEVDTLDEMGAFIARADYEGIEQSLLFENPKGFEIPVFANTIGPSYRRIARVFDVPVENALPGAAMKMGKVLQSGGIAPRYVDKKDAPCKDIIMTGDEVDLSKIPVLRLNPQDGKGTKDFLEGRFIGSLACSKPSEKAHNLSFHRFEITGKDSGTVWIFRGTGDARSMEEFWARKIDDPMEKWDREKARPFPMAYVLGVTPDFILAGANAALPWNYDDFSFVGGLTGEAVEMVKCDTIDVDVPANAEIIIEGVMAPFDWGIQGKFASFNGFYDEPRKRPVFRVTAITMRKNAIYQHVHIGRPLNETNNIAAFFRSMKILRDMQEVLPNVVDVFVDPAAGCGFTAHIALEKKRIGEPKMAMMRAYTALGGFCKHVFVYDADINIRDSVERDWALAHRFMADRDLMIIDNVIGMNIDPLAQGVVGSRSRLGVHDGHPEIPLNTRPFMGLDCTLPLGLKVMERVVPEPALEARVDEIWKAINTRLK